MIVTYPGNILGEGETSIEKCTFRVMKINKSVLPSSYLNLSRGEFIP
jgi:hypothetical protein